MNAPDMLCPLLLKGELTGVPLTRLPTLGYNSICVKASMRLLCAQLGSKPRKDPMGSQHVQSCSRRLIYETLKHPECRYWITVRIHKISCSVGSRPAVFRESSTTPDINSGDDLGSKKKNRMSGWNNSPQARTRVCWNRKGVHTLTVTV